MLARQPIFKATDPAVIGSGLQEDQALLQKMLWQNGLNVTFFNGRVKRRASPQTMFTAGSGPVRGLTQHQDSNGVRWVWAASGANIVRWYGPSPEAIWTSPTFVENETSVAAATQFDLTPYGNFMLINNSVDKVRLFKPGIGQAAIADAPTGVVQFMKKLNFVLAVGYGSAKTRIGWSDADNIETWTPTTENLAGSLSVEEFNTPIRAAAHVGQQIAVFGEDQMALLSYIGAPFYYGVKMALDGVGAIGKAALATDGRNVFGMGRGGLWWTDGLSFKYMDDAFMQAYFQDNINWDQGSKIVVARNDYTSCIEISFPKGTSLFNNEAWCFDPRNGSFSKLLPFSAKMERKLFNKPVLGTNAGVVQLDQNDKTAADALTLKTKPLLMQLQDQSGLLDSHNNSRIAEVDLFLKSAANVQFRVTASQNVDMTTNVSNSGWISCSATKVTYKMPATLRDGVYYTVEFQSTANTWDIDLQGFVMFGTVEGTKRGAT